MPGSRWPDGFARGRADRRALLVLACLRGLSPRKLHELAAREGTASACLAAVRGGRAGSRADSHHARALDPAALEAALAGCGARFVVPGDEEYVAGLDDLADPPAALFVRGHSMAIPGPRVAVVGARRCSATGKEVAEEIGAGLAAAGVCVVSGGARGIDSASHRGALRAGGPTIAVLGCGIDRAYPPASRSLIAEIAASGTLVSEYSPGVPAEAFRFPARNRIVAAVVSAVVVVEGAGGSGSLITTDHALDLGRQVFAVPGAVTSPLSEIPLGLIRDGAALIRGPGDLLADLGVGGGDEAAGGRRHLPPEEEAALAAVDDATLPEEVAASLGRPLREVVPVLMSLEMRGLLRFTGGRYGRRARGRN